MAVVLPVSGFDEVDPRIKREVAQLESIRSAWMPYLLERDAYLQGRQKMRFLSDEMRKEFGDDITELVLAFPELIVEAHNDRLNVEGFRFPGQSDGSERLWQIWQANNMDEQSVMGHEDALGLSKGAVLVGASPDGGAPPVITVESAFDTSWRRDPRSGRVVSALKRWTEDDDSEWMSLYLPDATFVLARQDGKWRVTNGATAAHSMGRVPLVPLVNRPRVKIRDGRSEFDAAIGLADAANKIATDMMISAEYHAMPRRWAFGLKRDDFRDKNGQPKPAWSFVKGRLWANENPDVKVGQFPEADLANFHNTIKLLARLVGQMTAMPIDYLSFDSVNPPSADALRAAESRLVKRVERRCVSFGGTWEEVMRVAMLVDTGALEDGAYGLETVWRDPATPTVAQKADAAMKLHAERIIPTEQTRIDLGYSPAQRAEMRRMDAEELTSLGLGGDVNGADGAGVGA